MSHPLLDEVSIAGARAVLVNITGGDDITLFELDEVAEHIRQEIDPDARIIIGSAVDSALEGRVRVSLLATGIEGSAADTARQAKDIQSVRPTPGVRLTARRPGEHAAAPANALGGAQEAPLGALDLNGADPAGAALQAEDRPGCGPVTAAAGGMYDDGRPAFDGEAQDRHVSRPSPAAAGAPRAPERRAKGLSALRWFARRPHRSAYHARQDTTLAPTEPHGADGVAPHPARVPPPAPHAAAAGAMGPAAGDAVAHRTPFAGLRAGLAAATGEDAELDVPAFLRRARPT